MEHPEARRRQDVTELLAVYDADGGLAGEARYLLGHLLGTAHCALCDITHSPVRRKPAWDALVRGLPVPVRVVHRNERTEQERAACTAGTPTVLARVADGPWSVLLAPADLQLDGSVDRFEQVLRGALGLPSVTSAAAAPPQRSRSRRASASVHQSIHARS